MVYFCIDYPHLQEPIHYHLTKRLNPIAGCSKKSFRIAFGKKSIKNLLLKINNNPFWRILNVIFERFLREANPHSSPCHQGVNRRQDLTGFAFEVDVRDVVRIGRRFHVDFDDLGAVALGDARNHIGWTDLPRSADNDKSVAVFGSAHRAVIGVFGDAFAEEDEVGLHQSAALGATGRFLGECQALGIDLVAAFGAHEARHVAVELIHHAVARHGVQVVDVLCDDAAQTAFFLPFGQDEVSGIRFDVLVAEEVIEHLADDLPRLLGVAIVEVDVE